MQRYLTRIAVALLATTGLIAQQPKQNSDNFLKPSEELNKLLPHWLQFSGEYRSRAEGTNAVGFNDIDDAYLLSRLWLGVKIQPAPWLKFFGQAQDARAFFNDVIPSAPPYQNRWDIHQAFVEVGDAEKYPLSVRVGRQELSFGDQRLVGPANWNNVPRVFDAVLTTVHLAGYRVSGFASAVVDSKDGSMDHHTQRNNFYGLYGSFTTVVPGATIEPYLFWRLSPLSLSPVIEHGGRGKLDQKTYGFRWIGKFPATFDYGMEMVRQQGSLGADSLNAWAGHWVVGRTLARVRATPRFLVEYNYASGDKDPRDGTRGTFDQLYPTAHDKYGLADQVGWRNIHDLRVGWN
jgi:alginate export protein